MRILFVDQFSEIGGAQRCFLDLLPAIEEQGWPVLAALPGSGPLASRLRTTRLACGPYGSGSKSSADVFRFALDAMHQTRTLSSLLSKGDFDLVYANGPRVLPGVALASRGRVPILFHAHNFLDRFYAAALIGWSVRSRVDTVVACSDFVAAPLRKYIPARRLQVVHNGSPDMGYNARSFDRPWQIGIVGRIEPQKGQAEFVQAARRIPNAQFIVCGAPTNGSSRYYEEVRLAARDLPVEFLGWQEDRASVYAKLDLLVLASQREGLPLAMLEAFSAGVPVVAFSAGGIRDVIQHNRTGFLVLGQNADALAMQIRLLMTESPARLRSVAAEARSLWERSFDLRRYRARMIEVLRGAACGKASPQECK
jgi:glycosyltransferase involved in cell wall biosynthesis